MCHKIRDAFGTHKELPHLAQLLLGLLKHDAVHSKITLPVVDQAEILSALVDADDIHEAQCVGHNGCDLAIDLNEVVHTYPLQLVMCQSVLESVQGVDANGRGKNSRSVCPASNGAG
ncbi:hypothetical protein HispidOSU_024559 [Sigmodon hispidus]